MVPLLAKPASMAHGCHLNYELPESLSGKWNSITMSWVKLLIGLSFKGQPRIWLPSIVTIWADPVMASSGWKTHPQPFLSRRDQHLLWDPVHYRFMVSSTICGAQDAFCTYNLFLLWMEYHAFIFLPCQVTIYPLEIAAVRIISKLSAAIYMNATGKWVPRSIPALSKFDLVTLRNDKRG